MDLMDHSEAVRLQAAEKYVLGELSPELQEAYEEHFFDCEECAADMKATAVFVSGSREVFSHEAKTAREPQAAKQWFAWLRPAIAAPVLAVLLVIVGYQSFVAIPRLQREASTGRKAQAADFISLIGANSRGEGARAVQLHRDRPTILEVDIPAAAEFSKYTCLVQNASGGTIYAAEVSAAEAKQTVHLLIPAGSRVAGEYTLAVLGEGASAYNASGRREIERLTFSVELLP